MLPENITSVVSRNETWTGAAASEPHEAGWAREAIIFVRALKEPKGKQPVARVEISPDGMRWVAEGTQAAMPIEQDGIAVMRVHHFGNWLRVAADFADGCESTVLVTIHLKA
ncbi:hypothetical protein REJC140_03602 [Pseudorhizobium endolithicum]|jgi:hypothetical protein|uniref:Uncharacterized protein n=1 Tax=Pseudorhizobium endolithicum TaxID=1191678 RepID=A0ABN7JM51_9HYPH|nr:hypothetical protein [Pseudorhizobium endolithicum]CAD6436394.1 hypothetical protein REQ54_03913 [Rhizobium sp. Q54]CAD7036974.1 hypothetical protein REJC140_03602 [Pseudorhizobium endolithicum]